MKSTGHAANIAPTPKTGLSVLLGGLLRVKGSGAPKSSQGSGAPTRLLLLVLATTLGVLAFTAVPALAVAPEAPKAEAPSEVKATSALLHGVLDPGKVGGPFELGFYEFVYRESKTECEGAGEVKTTEGMALGGGQEAVAQQINGLTAGTTYTVCLVEHDEARSASSTSAPVSFTTAIPPEKPETAAPGEVTATTAKLEGTVNPKTEAVTGYSFSYSTSGKCTEGASTAPVAPAKLKSPFKVPAAPMTGLEPSRKYEVCLIASNEAGETAVGNEVPLTTLPEKPSVESENVVLPVKASEAHLEGTVNPNNQVAECKLQYGTEPTLTTPTTVLCEPSSFPAGFGGQHVTLTLGGLAPHMTYYYRVLATNATGTEIGTIKSVLTATSPETPEGLEAQPLTATTATLKGVLNANNPGEAGTYEFAYRASKSKCQGGTPEEDKTIAPKPSTGAHPEPVSAAITELLPATPYTFCLIAHNSAGETSQSSVTFTTTASAPEVTSEYVTTVESNAATLNAQISPDGSATTYRFQYGPTETYGQETPETPLPANGHATATITGLTPGATYHYHVIATNTEAPTGIPGKDKILTTNSSLGTEPEACPNAQARAEQPYGLNLPDCRAYEMVSPLDKSAASAAYADSRVSTSGQAITYLSGGSFGEPAGAGIVSRYIAYREPAADRWSTKNITPPHNTSEPPLASPFGELFFTPELSMGLDFDEFVPFIEGEPPGFYNVYKADFTSSPTTYENITHLGSPLFKPFHKAPTGFNIAAATPDLTSIVLQAQENLSGTLPIENPQHEHVFDWHAGTFTQVDISPDGTEFPNSTLVGTAGEGYIAGDVDTWHAISEDGQRIFMWSAEEGLEGNKGQLYARSNPEQAQSPLSQSAAGTGTLTVGSTAVTSLVAESGSFLEGQKISGDGIPHGTTIVGVGSGTITLSAPAGITAGTVALTAGGECTSPAAACTIEVSASQRTVRDSNGPRNGRYWDASTDGSRVFFTSSSELTNNAFTGPNDNASNLYEYNFANGTLSDLTVDGEGDGAAVLGVVNASNDGSLVYFVAEGKLAAGATADQPNLYLYDRTAETPVRFIATLAPRTSPPESKETGGSAESGGDTTDWNGARETDGDSLGPGQHTARVTPDGTTLVFESRRSLTGYDNEPAEPQDCEQELTVNHETSIPCREVFVYSATTGKISCASCDPSGARPVADAEIGGVKEEYGFGVTSSFFLPGNLSEDGRRLFFETAVPLVRHDSNGEPDVYEWEAPGEGTCSLGSSSFSPSDGGCVYAISDVAGDNPSFFMNASPTGEDVFINTADQLVPSDTDTRADIYDVRVGGGFPVTTAPPVCVGADTCKAPVSPQPSIFGLPASATFSGPGNPPPPPPPAVATPKPKTAAQIKAEKLVKALKLCKKDKSKARRGSCEAAAQRKYGAAHKARRAANDRRAK